MNYRKKITEGINHFLTNGSAKNDAHNYGVAVDANPSNRYRCLLTYHLTPEENKGKHNVFIEVLDGDGLRIPKAKIEWGWAGMRPAEKQQPLICNKGEGEPAGHLDIYRGELWLKVHGDSSDTVSNLHYKHDDEPGPGGELWNSYGHHSFMVVFQKIAQSVPPIKPEVDFFGTEDDTQEISPVDLSVHAKLDEILSYIRRFD